MTTQQTVRIIPTTDVLLVARLRATITQNPQWFATRSTEVLTRLLAALKGMDRNGDTVVFEQPTPGTGLWCDGDESLPSMQSRGEIDQALLGHRFYKRLLTPVQVHVAALLAQRELDAMMVRFEQ